MTTRLQPSLLMSGVLALCFANLMEAQTCSTATTRGKYYVICDGYLTPAANAPLVPAKILSITASDDSGNITGAGSASIGGQIVSQVVTGLEKVNADCTGTVTFAQTIGGRPGPPLNATFYVVDGGDKIYGLITDPGAVMSCILTRTSKSLLATVEQPAPSLAWNRLRSSSR